MLRLPVFDYRRPATLNEAASELAENLAAGRTTRLVAGGTDLWPNLKRRSQKAEVVVSLASLPELAQIRIDPRNGDLHLGALALLDDVAQSPDVRDRFPALAAAVAAISSPVLRNAGTIGGNLCLDTRCTYYNQNEEWRRSIDYCMKEEGSVCWVAPGSSRCWAVSSSDSAPAFCALEARVTLFSSDRGSREIPVEALFRDDGIDYLAKQPDEILTQIVVPGTSDRDHCRQGFHKLRRRGSIDFAVASVATAVWTETGTHDASVTRARVWLGSVASRPVAAEECERALTGARLTAERIEAAAALARRSATPMDNTDFDPRWRGSVLGSLVRAALEPAIQGH